MAYTDYEFYTESYYGDTVPEDSFAKYAERASDYIDSLTYDRLIHNPPTDATALKKVYKAVCAVAEILYNIDLVRQAAMDSVGTVTNSDGTVTGKAVASMSSGTESVSYSTAATASSGTVYASAASDILEEKALVRQAATQYLAGVMDSTGAFLLYGGFNV